MNPLRCRIWDALSPRLRPKIVCGWGATPGFSMSGHLRFCFVVFFLAGLSTAPASANPFDALFNSAPAEATAPAPVKEECLPQPGKSTADGQHWVYRYDGHRKCWFEVAEGAATVKKPIHHAARRRVVAPDENESPLRNRSAVVDARDELPSAASTEAPQPTLPAPELKVVDAAPAAVAGVAALVPPAPVIAKSANDQLTPDHPMPRQIEAERLPADAPAAGDVATSPGPPANSIVLASADASNDREGWMATWPGVLLIALGLVFLAHAGRIIRRGHAGQDISPSEAGVGGHRGRRPPEPSFAFDLNTFDRPTNEKPFRPRSPRPASL